MNTASLDTSVIVRILVRDNEAKYKKSLKLLGSGLVFHFSNIAMLETVYVLESVYHKSRAEIIDLLTFFLARYDNVLYDRGLTRTVFPFYLEHPKLSFADCLLAFEAELSGAEPLFTFDQKLARQHPSAKLV